MGKHLIEAHEDLVIRCVERCYLKPSGDEFDSYVYNTEQENMASSAASNEHARDHVQEERSLRSMTPRPSRHGSNQQRSIPTQRSDAISLEDEYDFGTSQQESQRKIYSRKTEDDQYYCIRQQIYSPRQDPASRDVIYDRNLRSSGNGGTHSQESYENHDLLRGQRQNSRWFKRAPASKEDPYGCNQQQIRGIQRRPLAKDRDTCRLQESRPPLHALAAEPEAIYERIDDVNKTETEEDIYDSPL